MYITSPEIEKRFWSKVEILGPEDCWEWQAYICGATGYGRFGTKYPQIVGAHRFSYFISNKVLPEVESVLHTCDTPACVNPNHLWLGTHADNMADMADKGRAGHRGERSWNNKLSEQDIINIRFARRAGVKGVELAEHYNVYPQHINAIARGVYWPHVGGPLTSRFN